MTTHIYHPDSHTHGLADGCPRCEEHAEDPLVSLDYENIRRLVEGRVFTSNDRRAAARLADIAARGRRLESIVGERV